MRITRCRAAPGAPAPASPAAAGPRAPASSRTPLGCQPRVCFRGFCFRRGRMSWGRRLLCVAVGVPAFDLRALHDDGAEADVRVVVDDGVGDVAGVFDVDVVADGGGEREGLVGHPVGGLDGGVVADLGLSAHADRVGQSVHHCSEPHVAALRDGDVAEDGGVGGHVGRAGDGQRVLLDVEDVAVAVDGLQEGDVLLEQRPAAVQLQPGLAQRPAHAPPHDGACLLHRSPGEPQHAHLDNQTIYHLHPATRKPSLTRSNQSSKLFMVF